MNVDRVHASRELPLAVELIGALARVGAGVGVVWLVVRMFIDTIGNQMPVQESIAKGMVGPAGWVFITSALISLAVAWMENRPPRNPRPGELWRYKVNQVDDLLRAKLREAQASPSKKMERVAFELAERHSRLQARYFPPERPPRRYRKLSKC